MISIFGFDPDGLTPGCCRQHLDEKKSICEIKNKYLNAVIKRNICLGVINQEKKKSFPFVGEAKIHTGQGEFLSETSVGNRLEKMMFQH